MKLGFKKSQNDECVFYFGKTVFIVYTDDTILLGPDKDEIDLLLKRLSKSFKIEDQGDLSDYTILLGPDKDEIDLLVKRLSKSFKIEDQGDLSDYLGIKIER